MTANHRRFWQRANWVAALGLGLAGGAAAMQKERLDAERDARLARLEIEQLSSHNQAIEALRDGAGHGYAILDEAGLVREWNGTLERWTGYTRAEMLGQSVEVVMPPGAKRRHRHSYAATIGDPASHGKTFAVHCKLKPRGSDQLLPVRVTSRIVAAASGDRYVIAFIDRERDVVELKTAMDAP